MDGAREIFQMIVFSTKAVIPALQLHDIHPHESLSDLGADSVDKAEILMMVSESLHMQIPRVEFFGPRNLGELAALLHEKACQH